MDADRWQQVERVCHAALAQAPEARAAFLAEACGDDLELHREVASLLAQAAGAETFLESPPDLPVPAKQSPSERGDLEGHRFGNYEVEALIATGGMGDVYRARDLKLGRQVAIKDLPATFACDAERLKRFRQEARTLAELNHPNILTIHDVGEYRGRPYVVTELLEGDTLRQVLTRRVPTLDQALAYALQAAEGLAAAHRKGVVHRDLKPENVFLTTEGRIKLLDFGLAKHVWPLVSDSGPPLDDDSHPGLVVGTAAYLSPERADGAAVDARADIFAFGCVLYELLAGRHPFRRDTLAATLEAIVHDMPPDLAGLGLGIPAAVSAVVRRCLQKIPEARFPAGADLARALAALVPASRGAPPLDALEERAPYPGLRAFLEEEADLFVGREAEITALWEQLRARPLLALIGPAGAGKTSFVRAGLLPATPAGWTAITCTPGTSPMRNLGQALASELTADLEALRQLVNFDDVDVALRLLEHWRTAHAGALVVVDQFEELFTLNPVATQATFAAFVGRVARQSGVHVLLSMRDDFLIRCCEYPALTPVLSKLTALLPLGPDALRRTLVEPAATIGYRFEDARLADEMVAAVAGTRAPLPLLAFAVAQLWNRRDRHRQLLTRAAYEDIGGVAGALAQHAETTLERIGLDRQPIARELFRNLVTAHSTRAVRERDELLTVWPDREAAFEVLRSLLDARLITSYETTAGDGHPARDLLEIAHESLITTWPRLVRWQAQDREGAVLREQLRQAAHLWVEKGRSPDLLWTGLAYREFALWRDLHDEPLSAVEEDFARAMTARARRTKRLRSAAVAALIVGLVGVAFAIGVSRQQALAGARQAEASRLVALGRLELQRYPSAAVAYARTSLQISDTMEARLLAVEALWRGPTARILKLPRGAACSRVEFSADGSALACAGFTDKVVLWRDDGTATVFGSVPTTADTRSVGFDLTGQRLFSWVPGDPALRTWTLDGHEQPSLAASAEWAYATGPDQVATLGPTEPASRERVLRRWTLSNARADIVARWMPPQGMRLDQPGLRPVSVARDLQTIAFGDGNTVVVRRLVGAAAERRFGNHAFRIREVAFDAAARRLLSLDESGVIRIWEVASGALLRELTAPTPHRYSRPVFGPGAFEVTWTSGDGTTHLWNLRAPVDAPPLAMRRTDVRDAGDESFHPKGHWLATADWSNVALWPIAAPQVYALPGHVEGPLLDLEFSPDSRLLASCARDGGRIWPLTPAGGRGRRLELSGDYYCYGVAFTPDSRSLVLNSPYLGTFLVGLGDGRVQRLIDLTGRRMAPMPVTIDVSRRRLVIGSMYAPASEDMALTVLDLEHGTTKTFPLRTGDTSDGYASSAYFIEPLATGEVLVAGPHGLRRFDLGRGEVERIIWDERGFVAVATAAAGRMGVALVGQLSPNRLRLFGPELLVLDGQGRPVRRIETHGNALMPTVALDPAGEIVVTGDASGIVRVGSIDGAPPHLLIGHDGPVNRVAVSPDGEWVASASGSQIRLWPMPDVSKPPLHALSFEELIKKLDALTNLRVVPDQWSATGYRLDVGPFHSWRDVPTW